MMFLQLNAISPHSRRAVARLFRCIDFAVDCRYSSRMPTQVAIPHRVVLTVVALVIQDIHAEFDRQCL